jgi:hypothetical protein
MLVAFGLIAATLWFGLIGLLRPSGDPAATTVARAPGAAGPAGTAGTAASARPGTPALAAASDIQLVRLTEAELTESLRQALARESGGVQVDNPRVRIVGGRLEVTGQARGILPLPLDFRLIGRAEARDGRPVVAVERVEGVGVPLPDAAARRLESLVNAAAPIALPAGVTVTRIEAGDGALTVYGRR